MAIASLTLGVLSIPTFGCLIVGAAAGVVLGILALTRANREPEVYGGKGIAIAGIAASALSLLVAIPLAILAAIAIPSLLRARTNANEAVALRHVKAFAVAESIYRGTSGGTYGPPECLADPAVCLPGYDGPALLDADLASDSVVSGYRRTFHPGPSASVSESAPGSPFATRRLSSFAYTAVPVERGRTGNRAFCADASGRVCAAASGEVEAASGACPPPPECADL